MGEFILRNDPKVKIVLFNDRLEIHESDKQITNYLLKEIDSLQIRKRINWLVSIFSFLVGLFFSTSGDVYKERDQLQFNYKGKPVEISLKGGDKDMAIEAANKVNQFIREACKTN